MLKLSVYMKKVHSRYNSKLYIICIITEVKALFLLYIRKKHIISKLISILIKLNVACPVFSVTMLVTVIKKILPKK